MHDYKIGETFSRTITFDAEAIKQFATLAGDENPLHHDEQLATASRFGGLIASGTHYSALMMGMIATHFTRQGAALGLGFSFQFRKPVHAGETVRLEWRITEIERKPSLRGDVITLAGWITGQDGRPAVRATASVLALPPECV